MARLVMDVEHSDLNTVVLEEIMDLVRFYGNCQDDTPYFTVESAQAGDVRGVVMFQVEWDHSATNTEFITSDGKRFGDFDPMHNLKRAREHQADINSGNA